MPEMMARKCAYCGTKFETADERKIFCTKQHADRSRNLPRIPVGYDGAVTIEDFNRYPTDVKQRMLRGETGLKIVGFDLECTDLKPTIGRILCASFTKQDGTTYTFSAHDRGIKRADVYDDSKLAIKIRDELEAADIIIGHNSKMFDLRFLNTRLMRVGQRTKAPQFHIDTMWSWRSKSSGFSGLDNIQKFMLPDGTHKTPIKWEQWMRALGWNKKLRDEAMAEIVEHCENDTRLLMEVFSMLVEANVIRTIKRDGGVL
jgi:uncharacterized protein YprB with RNaseH-like and TPR domain